MEQRPPWEADSHSASQEIPCLLCNPKVHFCIYWSLLNINRLIFVTGMRCVFCEVGTEWSKLIRWSLWNYKELKKFPVFYGTRRFNTVFTRWIQSTFCADSGYVNVVVCNFKLRIAALFVINTYKCFTQNLYACLWSVCVKKFAGLPLAVAIKRKFEYRVRAVACCRFISYKIKFLNMNCMTLH
jgi:hypothetical protein